nr:tetratricopeptide repeat protein [Candidatus Sigynarchaeota archaeon]
MTNQSSLKAASFPPASIKAVMNIITAHLEHGVSASFVNIMRTIREQKRNGSIKLSNREIKALFDFLVATGFLKRQNDETFVISNTLDHDGGLPKQGLSSGRKAKSIQDDEFGSCIQRGIKSNNDKDYDSAILAYRRALEIEPRSSAIWNCLGVSLCNKNDFQGAATAFQEAIKLNPADKLYWSNFGTALFNQGDFNKAIEVLNKSLAIDKNNALIWQLLGLSFDKLDNFDSMIDAFQHGLQLAQGSVKDAMIGWLEEKSDHIGYTDWEKHVRIYKLLAMIPGTAKYKHEYVHRLVMAGCYREALEMAKKYQDSFQDAFLRIENKILQVFCFLLLNEMDNATSAYPTPAELQQHHLAFRYNRAIHHNLYYVLFQRCKELCGLQGTELAGALYFHETSGVEFDDHLKILKNWYEIIRSVREYFAWRLVRPFYENQQQN